MDTSPCMIRISLSARDGRPFPTLSTVPHARSATDEEDHSQRPALHVVQVGVRARRGTLPATEQEGDRGWAAADRHDGPFDGDVRGGTSGEQRGAKELYL